MQECTAILFADDTCINSKNIECLRSDVINVQEWLKMNKLALNPKKSQILSFKANQNGDNSVLVGDVKIQATETVKYLGVFLDKNFKFLTHVRHVTAKISKLGGMLRQMREILIRDHLLLFYNCYIKPIIQYGLIAYGNTSYNKLNDICLVQKRIVKTIFKLQKSAGCSEFFVSNKVFTVHELYVVELLRVLIDLQTNQEVESDSLKNILNDNKHHKYQTRSRTSGLLGMSENNGRGASSTLKKRLRLAFNIWTRYNLFPVELHRLSSKKLKGYVRKISELYILGNNDLINLIFDVI